MTTLRIIDTTTLRAERIAEYERLLMTSCRALNKVRSAQDAYELGEGSLADVHRAQRALRKIDKATDAAELAAYGLKETAERRAKAEAIIADVKAVEEEWRESPEFRKRCLDFENRKNYGARPTRHAGFTIIDGGRS